MTRPRLMTPPPCLLDVIRAIEAARGVTLAKELQQ
jgi:hypothetical protein